MTTHATRPRKVLVIGSGPIIIGQAAEFDYAGSQACRALREEGIVSVLVNSNPATIMTDQGVADIVYIEPLTVDSVARIIERERPDGLLPTLGGQTGLNLAVALAESGVLDRYGVRLLGTRVETIKNAEDRELFKQLLISIGEPVPESRTCYTIEEAREFVFGPRTNDQGPRRSHRRRPPLVLGPSSLVDSSSSVDSGIGLPVVIRPAFTLGGTGGGMAFTEAEFERIVEGGLRASPVHQVLVERCLVGWKELEYEVMRDAADNCITICNMENVDPMGVHTGDSIVVAPSQTLSDREYQQLRAAALKIIRALGIEGGCNVQFALDPGSQRYYVIEVNPRVSRSSALASKATGYPIARVATKIAVGKRLDEIPNAVTGKTTAAFEPALDYVVVKIPRWPFDKFPSGDRTLGTQMKATGEVMAIDRSFPAALQKAVRSLEVSGRTLLWEDPTWTDHTQRVPGRPTEGLWRHLSVPNDLRVWALAAALRHGCSIEEVHQATHIDRWFLKGIERIIQMERRLLAEPLTPELMRQAKRLGFSDAQIGTLSDRLPEQVRELRLRWRIRPTYKMVDTCAAEFEARTPYFYSTWEQENEAPPLEPPKAIVLGSGPIRIGQGIEFDYASVHAAWALQAEGLRAIMVNSNPETVSTDFDTSDRLYFEPLDEESVRNIIENESGDGLRVMGDGEASPPPSPHPQAGTRHHPLPITHYPSPAITQFGGQTAINLAEPLERACCALIGSGVEAIDLAEDRRRFERLLNELGIPQPPGGAVTRLEDALQVASNIGYPVLVRPSYVLGGRAMEIVQNATELIRYVTAAAEISERRPILVDKYLQGKEVEVDAICDGESVLVPGIMEHVERAGVHSGDSVAVYPGVNLAPDEVETIVDYTTRIGLALNVRGLMNVQFVLFDGGVYVLEVNPRASRTVPFLSKVTGVPMTRLATAIALGRSLREQGYAGGLWPRQKLVAVKAPVFSMAKLIGVDSYLGPEMKSTGEVMGIDFELPAAMAKAAIAAGMALHPPERGGVLLSISDQEKPGSVPLIRKLVRAGYALYATEGTAAMIKALELPVRMVTKKLDQGHPNVVDVIRSGEVRAVINTVTGDRAPLRDGFEIRRAAVESGVTLFSSLDTASAVINAMLGANGEGAGSYNILPLSEYTGRSEGADLTPRPPLRAREGEAAVDGAAARPPTPVAEAAS